MMNTVRLTFSVGRFVRGHVRRELAHAQFDFAGADGELEIREGKGFWSSDFHVRGRGPAALVERLVGWAAETVGVAR